MAKVNIKTEINTPFEEFIVQARHFADLKRTKGPCKKALRGTNSPNISLNEGRFKPKASLIEGFFVSLHCYQTSTSYDRIETL